MFINKQYQYILRHRILELYDLLKTTNLISRNVNT